VVKGPQRPSAPIVRVCSAGPTARRWRRGIAIDLDRRADQRQVAGEAAVAVVEAEAAQLAVEHDLGSGAISSVSGGWPVRKRHISANALAPSAVSRWSMPAITTFCAPFSAGPSKADVGGDAALADPGAFGLGVLVVVVRTQGQPLDARRDLVPLGALRRVEPRQQRTLAVELAARQEDPVRPDAVIRHAAEDGVRHLAGAAAGDEVADRVAAAREADQHDLRRAGRRLHPLHLGGEAAVNSAIEVRPAAPCRPRCGRSDRAGRSPTCRSRGQPLVSKRQIVVVQTAAVSPLPWTKTIGGRDSRPGGEVAQPASGTAPAARRWRR
jgi:hypothetical protein